MARYTYHGPFQTIELRKGKDKDGKPEFDEITLVPGSDPLSLPDDNPIVTSMVDAKLLRRLPTKPRQPKPGEEEPKGADK